MNQIEINEISEMREQLATLKKQLNNQSIINDRLIKEAISQKISHINRSGVAFTALCAFYIPAGFVSFRMIGLSLPFCIATSLLFLIFLVGMIIGHRDLRNQTLHSGDLISTYKAVARTRKVYQNWRKWAVPLAVVWVAWGGYDIYTNVTQDVELLRTIAIAGSVGAIIGGIIGDIQHRKTLRATDEILRQIEELNK